MSKWKLFTYIVASGLTVSVIVDFLAWNLTPATLVHICALIIIFTRELDEWFDDLNDNQ